MNLSSEVLLSNWKIFSGLPIPGRKRLFSKIVGIAVPYTGSMSACIENLSPGKVELSLKDRRKIRNHLGSIHAIALANLGEFASGLAVISLLTPQQRAILVKIQVEYIKKARGTLKAISEVVIPTDLVEGELQAVGKIYNAEQVLVATVLATWRIGFNKGASK